MSVTRAAKFGLDGLLPGDIRRIHDASGPSDDAPPPPLPGRRTDYRIIDLPGGWGRTVVGSEFDETVEALPLGAVLVTLRLEPNEANRYGISAYIHGRQVGYLSTQWNARDPWVKFITKLDKASILPRFIGVHGVSNSGHRDISFDVPGRDDDPLPTIANRLIKDAAR